LPIRHREAFLWWAIPKPKKPKPSFRAKNRTGSSNPGTEPALHNWLFNIIITVFFFDPFVFTGRLLTMGLHRQISSTASCLWHALLPVYHFLFAVNLLLWCQSTSCFVAPTSCTNVPSAFAGNLEYNISFHQLFNILMFWQCWLGHFGW